MTKPLEDTLVIDKDRTAGTAAIDAAPDNAGDIDMEPPEAADAD